MLADFFEPSIQCIFDAVRDQRRAAAQEVSVSLKVVNSPLRLMIEIQTVFLVGGFAASDYLFMQLQERLREHGFSVHRPDAHL